MPTDDNYASVLDKLRSVLASLKQGQQTYDDIVAPRDAVFAKFRPIFAVDHIPILSKEEFVSFLYFENNRHRTDYPRYRRNGWDIGSGPT